MHTQEQSVNQEMRVHGRRWETIRGGYFTDPEDARPLVEAICHAIDLSHPMSWWTWAGARASS